MRTYNILCDDIPCCVVPSHKQLDCYEERETLVSYTESLGIQSINGFRIIEDSCIH